ncbi:unnamed protein product, partial [Ixodes hexagonus]
SYEGVEFKTERFVWSSTKYWFQKGAIPEESRCHGCRCVPDIIYPLNNCGQRGLCRDCIISDFTCHQHSARRTGKTLSKTAGKKNDAAKKIFVLCPVCDERPSLLRIEEHILREHPYESWENDKNVEKTEDEQVKGSNTQERCQAGFETSRKLSSRGDTCVKCEPEDQGTLTCEHCQVQWEECDFEEHRKACPKKNVRCRECGDSMKQGETAEHKASHILT